MAGWAFLLVLVEHTLEQYYLLLCLVRLLHGFLQRDGVVKRDELCAWVGYQSLCCLLVASVVDAVVIRPSLAAGLVRFSVAALVAVTRVVPHAFSPAQIRGLRWPACVLPRGDGMVHARERAQDITPPFPPEHGCDALPVVLHGS